jgi:hypothetical protein
MAQSMVGHGGLTFAYPPTVTGVPTAPTTTTRRRCTRQVANAVVAPRICSGSLVGDPIPVDVVDPEAEHDQPAPAFRAGLLEPVRLG